jgi:hypothetical protein
VAEISKGVDPLKATGSALVMIGSIFLLIHRIPHHEYAEKHKDKGRPKAPAPAADYYGIAAAPGAASTSASSLPQLGSSFAASSHGKSRPVPAAPAVELPPLPAFPVLSSTALLERHPLPPPPPLPEAVASQPLDVETACVAESSLLCNRVPITRLTTCLASYHDALTNTCHEALKQKGQVFPAPPIELEFSCLSEARLLCYHVPKDRLVGCLTPYNEALRGSCRVALKAKGVQFETDD